MIADLLESGDTNFNHIHKEVLLFDKEELRPFREISARKKPYDNLQVSFIAYASVRGKRIEPRNVVERRNFIYWFMQSMRLSEIDSGARN